MQVSDQSLALNKDITMATAYIKVTVQISCASNGGENRNYAHRLRESTNQS